MKRTYKTAAALAAVAVLGGLAGCTSSSAGAAEDDAAPAVTAPADDTQRMCRAVAADTSVGDRRLDDVTAADAARVLRVATDLEGRLRQYPGAGTALKQQVQVVADEYKAAAGKAAKAKAFDAEVVKLRAAQTKLAGMCS